MAFQIFEIKQRGKVASGPYDEVCAAVRPSLEQFEPRFLWDSLYVPLVRAVFPELAGPIDKLIPRMDAIAAGSWPVAAPKPAGAAVQVLWDVDGPADPAKRPHAAKVDRSDWGSRLDNLTSEELRALRAQWRAMR